MARASTPRVVVITGGTGGIGRATVRRLAARRDRIALIARGDAGLKAAAADAERWGATVLPVEVDVADFAAVDRAASRIEEELGPIDVWVNDAFTSVFAPFTEITPDEYRRVTEVTYLGYVHGTRAALDRMLPRDRGTIVQVGSALAHRGIPLQSAYCGARHAIKGFTESVRCELLHARSAVRVTVVDMPAVNTPQFDWVKSRLPRHAQPVAPIYQPEVAARAIEYAIDHPRRRAYWVGTSTVGTIVANRFVPGLLDRYLARTAFDAQQTGDPRSPRQPSNLWEAADETADFGAHGDFDRRSHGWDPQLWASRHHGLLAAVAGLAVTGIAAARVRGR